MTQPIRWLQREIADRMLQKLDIVKLEVRDLLVIPDFPGEHLALLRKRFPRAALHGVFQGGLSGLAALYVGLTQKLRRIFWGDSVISLPNFLQTGRLELPDNSVDLVFSDLLLHDLPQPQLFLKECRRVLREGGLLTFSYLGPDTGKELFALQGVQNIALKRLASPWDMHDMGDALLGERFSDPVMDMEFITLDYDSTALLLSDADALGLLDAVPAASESLQLPQKLTLELVYGHAWAIGKHLAKAQNQVAYIDAKQIKRKTSSDSA